MSDPHISDEQLSAHLDGALNASRGNAVAAHLAECEECSGRLDLMRAVSRAVAGLPVEEPPRALDLGFLSEGAAAAAAAVAGAAVVTEAAGDGGSRPERSRPGWLRRFLGGRPASFAGGGLATAAAFVIAVLVVAPGALSSFRGASQQGATSQGSLAGGPGGPAPAAGGASPGANALRDQGAAPGGPQGSAAKPPARTQATPFQGGDGLSLTLSTSVTTVRSGESVTVVFRMVGGNSDQTLSPYYISLSITPAAGGPTNVLYNSSGDSLVVRAHSNQEVDYQWTAPTGTGGPGNYNLVATINGSSSSGTVAVPITIS